MFRAFTLGALLMAAATTAPALAAPMPPATTAGRDISATGTQVRAMYLFSEAADASQLWEINVLGGVLFQNGSPGDAPGTTRSFSTVPGAALVFELRNLANGLTFRTGAGSTNVSYLDYSSSDSLSKIENALGVDITVPESQLESLSSQLLVIGFEDRALASSDQDFNDLIFAFGGLTSTSVPEPGVLFSFGAALLGLGLLRRTARTG